MSLESEGGTSTLPRHERMYFCAESKAQKAPHYGSGQAAHRGDLVAIDGEDDGGAFKVVALDFERHRVQVADEHGRTSWVPANSAARVAAAMERGRR